MYERRNGRRVYALPWNNRSNGEEYGEVDRNGASGTQRDRVNPHVRQHFLTGPAYCALAAVAMAYGWGYRGTVGHEAGAMVPGALLG